MWNDLPKEEKDKYKKMILGLSALSPVFAQKQEAEDSLVPVIFSKFQESAFKSAFHGVLEDVGNTSFDVSLKKEIEDKDKKYLVGIKTFGYGNSEQKVAQFKSDMSSFLELENQIKVNAEHCNTPQEIGEVNEALYKQFAIKVSELRNDRIESAKQNLRGFQIQDEDNVELVYHVLMPMNDGNAKIYVGETSYEKIDIENIEILGCTSAKNAINFRFSDGKHTYKFTPADSQLYMNFDNANIILEDWNVKYVENAEDIILGIYDDVYTAESKSVSKKKTVSLPVITESYSWTIADAKGEVPLFSGFNAFYGVGSKASKDSRENKVNRLETKYTNLVNTENLTSLCKKIKDFLLMNSTTDAEKKTKVELREDIISKAIDFKNEELLEDVKKLVYRPVEELYIPIPQSEKFHKEHPKFFTDKMNDFSSDKKTSSTSKEDRKFNLVFEPSGDSVEAFVTQDSGKAIESADSQAILGEWILRKVFQLKPYEPLTTKRMDEIGKNGIRLYKIEGSNDVHLEFIWIDIEEPPKDFIPKIR